MDLKGRLSNPLDIAETPAAQGSERVDVPDEGVESDQNRPSDDAAEKPGEEKGRLSNPPQRRLSPADVDNLIAAYRTGVNITQLAAEYAIHRTTVAAHLDRHGVPRHCEETAWNDESLGQAAERYATGSSLADVADQFGIDAQTVADRFRRAGIPVRPRRGWNTQIVSEQHPRPS